MPGNESRQLIARAVRAVVWGMVIGMGLPRAAQAGYFSYGLGFVAEHSDNITRAPAGSEVSESIRSYSAGAAYREDSPVLHANILAQAEYRDYVHDVYEDGPLYFADAVAEWNIIPQRFTWEVRDRYDYGVLDPGAPYTPTNRTAINVFETGPELRVPVGPRNTLGLGARYGDVHYSDAETDHTRGSASVRWLYEVNASTTWALNYEVLDLDYENDVVNIDSRRQDYYLRYLTREGRSEFVADLGGMTISRDRAERVDGTLVRLSLLRTITQESTVNVLIAGEYTDAGTVLLETGADASGGAGTEAVSRTATSDLFYAKRAEAGYVFAGTQVGANVRAFTRDLDYLIVQQDRREVGGDLTLTHNPQGTIATSLFGRTVRSDYRNGTGREDDESEYGVRVAYRASRELALAIEGKRQYWHSNVANVGYDDRRALLTLTYRSSPLFTAPPRR